MAQDDIDWLVQPVPWTPHKYSLKAVKFLLEHAAAGLFLDPGLGKTSITYAAIKMLLKKKVVKKVLIIAPLRVCHLVWPAEQKKWKDFSGLRVIVLHGPDKDQLLQQDADIYVINPEGLDWLTQVVKTRSPRTGKVSVSVDLKRFKKFGFDLLVVDELSKFKHTSSGRFKILKKIRGTFSRIWGLTGSPAPNGLLDLFGQCFILDGGRSLGTFITNYRMKYFIKDHSGFGWDLTPGSDQLIYERIAPLVLRMSAEDYLDMPDLIENRIRVDLPEKARIIYDKVEADLFAAIDKRIVVASTAAVASVKCRQIANGGIYLEPELEQLLKGFKPKREWVNLHTAKIEALQDLVDELQGKPLFVAYDFEHDMDRIKTAFGDDIPFIGSGVNMKKTKEIEKAWNDGKIPLLFAHPQAVAHGLNLQESGSHVCWHSLTWDYELWDQFIRRIYRQGSKASHVTVHCIIARDTIDESIIGAIKSKRKGQNALFEALKERASRRPVRAKDESQIAEALKIIGKSVTK
jgi:SNF2 family DNA or RNA helicase